MRSERLARMLLRVYPRNWRERYGDEFLALVSESGLTRRAVVDILIVATIERVRRLLELARAEMVVPSPLPQPMPMTASEIWLTQLGFGVLGSALVLVCSQFGAATPKGFLWVQPFVTLLYFDGLGRVTRATISERIVLTFAWFVVAVWITSTAFLVGDVLRGLDVPLPSDRAFHLLLATVFVSGLARFGYRGIASALNKPRPDFTRGEIWGWSFAIFLLGALVGMAEPTDRSLWSLASFWSMWLAFVRTRHVLAARRRALREQRGF
jgi:hypothetical protein